MIIPMSGEPTQNYKQYKNQKFTKHSDILKNSIRQIKDCSLKPDDKKRLLVVLSEILVAEMDKIAKELTKQV